MKLFPFPLILPILVFGLSCSSSSELDDNLQTSDYLLFENELMSCYCISTKADDRDVRITLTDYPDIEIYVVGVPITKSYEDRYDYTAFIFDNGEHERTVDYSVSEINNGVTLTYSVDNIEEETIVLTTDIVSEGRMGKYIAECIQDAYINHGWASVFTNIASWYCPYVGAAILGACIAHYTMGK